jgi:hypothetical protein
MTAPCGGVLARAMALGLGCVENSLYASPKPRCSLRLLYPYRLQDREDGLYINFIDRAGPEDGGPGGEAPAPLIAMLCVAPLMFFSL